MSKNTIRPYEMSVWNLRDRYLATLKAPGVENKGHIQNPEMKLNVDGTQELTFKVPMYYFKDNNLIENPYWYDIKNGLLLIGMRKIKVIFNKMEPEEEIFEFLVTDVKEQHDSDNTLFCEVECSGMFFQELGKKGYKISLTEDDYYNDYDEYIEAITNNDNSIDEPINNINYWCDKVFENSEWYYSIQMDWTSYDGIAYRRSAIPGDALYYNLELITEGLSDTGAGPIVGIARVGYAVLGSYSRFVNGEYISYQDLTDTEKELVNEKREAAGLRLNNKVYEDEYVTSWDVDVNNEKLVPREYEKFKEKCRLMEESNSNIYNLTQAIAEKFGVFCKYKYHYDDNYHIVAKEVIFYNSFNNEFNKSVDLTYGYSASSISRQMDSNDLCTKLIVESVEDDSSLLGPLSIMNTPANKSGEDYLLNFEYLHNTGEIDDDQYEEIEKYETAMKQYNDNLVSYSKQITSLENELNLLDADLAITNDIITQSANQREQALASLNALTKAEKAENGITLTLRGYTVLQDKKNNDYYIKLSFEGITSINGIFSDVSGNTSVTFTEKRTNGFITELHNLALNNLPTTGVKNVYVTFTYQPQIYYKTIADIFEAKQRQAEAKKSSLNASIISKQAQLDTIQENYDTILYNKQARIADFEKMMGPALREGYWQPEDYQDYGDKFTAQFNLDIRTLPALSDAGAQFYWDDEPFDDEQLSYYEEEIMQERKYYPYINLWTGSSPNVRPYWQGAGIKPYLDADGTTPQLQFTYREKINGEWEDKYFILGSTMQLAFRKYWSAQNQREQVVPILLLTGFKNENEFPNLTSENRPRFCYSNTLPIDGTDSNDFSFYEDNFNPVYICDVTLGDIVGNPNATELCYPRIIINNLGLKVSENELKLLAAYNNESILLRDYYDYSILTRDEAYYITPNAMWVARNSIVTVQYTISNAELNIYLDAREVSKTNSIPQVSYEIELMALNPDFIKKAYKELNQLVNINDFSLKFENVKGYISNIELKLDTPWEDSVEIKNYKTKFEDLFTKIVATTEQMKANADIYNKAASAFNSTGTIKAEALQEAIRNSPDLALAFKKGALTINEKDGICASSEDGAVMMSGGGIFCATTRDGEGNWEWNTGILPSGINASLITTGQLDTNLIRIFAGDNLRLQMNGDGLFAYKDDTQKQYVVHNEDGLFLVAKAGTVVNNSSLAQDITRVAISWNGFEMRNYNNQLVFQADANTGNLTISGTINATAGEIGGFAIDNTSIHTKNVNVTSNDNNSVGLSSSTFTRTINSVSRNNLKLAIGSKFGVASDGTIYAGGATISGNITATTGSIGGWTIGSNYIGNANSLNDSTIGLRSGATGSTTTFWAGGAYNGSPAFKVAANGTLTATGATISGNITATTGTIGGFKIDSTSIRTNDVAITSNANNSVGFSSADFTRNILGEDRTGLRLAIGSKFGVTNTGKVYAQEALFNSVNITGQTILNTSGTVEISGDYLKFGYELSGPYTSGLFIKKIVNPYATATSIPFSKVFSFTTGSGAELIIDTYSTDIPYIDLNAEQYYSTSGYDEEEEEDYEDIFNTNVRIEPGKIHLLTGADNRQGRDGTIILDAGEVCFRKDNTIDEDYGNTDRQTRLVRLVVGAGTPSFRNEAEAILWFEIPSKHPSSWKQCTVWYKEFE